MKNLRSMVMIATLGLTACNSTTIFDGNIDGERVVMEKKGQYHIMNVYSNGKPVEGFCDNGDGILGNNPAEGYWKHHSETERTVFRPDVVIHIVNNETVKEQDIWEEGGACALQQAGIRYRELKKKVYAEIKK